MEQQQQGIRRRFSRILTSSIGICRSKRAANAPLRSSREPIPATLLTSRVCLSDLFSADSDTTTYEKFESDKTLSGSEAERASMSHLSPFEYETFDTEVNKFPVNMQRDECQEDFNDNFSLFQTDYYRKLCSSSDRWSGSDIPTFVLVELSQARKFPEYIISLNKANNNAKNDVNGNCTKPRRRSRRKRRKNKGSEAVVIGSVAMAKRSLNPYEDFKKSMMEMIMEMKMFAREELEELLISFLGLNSPDHHKIIVRVFVDILHFLFSNSCDQSSFKLW